jgi:hypothetical protein
MSEGLVEIDTADPAEWPADTGEWPRALVVRDIDGDGWAVFRRVQTGEGESDV